MAYTEITSIRKCHRKKTFYSVTLLVNGHFPYIEDIDVVFMVFIRRCVSALVVEFDSGGSVTNSVTHFSSMYVLIYKLCVKK